MNRIANKSVREYIKDSLDYTAEQTMILDKNEVSYVVRTVKGINTQIDMIDGKTATIFLAKFDRTNQTTFTIDKVAIELL